MRRILVAPVLFLLAACQPQQPPNTAAPAAPQGSIDLPAAEATHRYDSALAPVDETRTPRKVELARSVPPARPPAARSERETQAIARWDKEEAALGNEAPPLGLRPPPVTRVGTLSLPTDSSALPRPSPERAAPVKRSDAALPPPVERPASVAPVEPVKASASPAPPPPAPSSPAPPPPEPAVVATPAAPPVESAPPVTQTASAAPPAAVPPAPVAKPGLPPSGPPLTTVTFTPRSANLSDGARVALGWFAREPETQRLRRIELWSWSGDGDPVLARQIALARALAVHAFLIDLGVKAQIDIAGFDETAGASPDRVDVMLRR